MKLGNLLRNLRHKDSLTQEQVVGKIGITQPYLSRLEISRSILSRTYIPRRIADLFKVDCDHIKQLSEKDELEFNKRQLEKKYGVVGYMPIPPGATKRRRIPILNEIPAGIPNGVSDYDFPPGITEDYVDNYLKGFTTADPSTYALRVAGDYMEPELKKGDIVLLFRTKNWESGDIVAVSWNDGAKRELQRIIKQDNHIILKSENPKYDPVVLNKNDGPKIMGVYIMFVRIPRK